MRREPAGRLWMVVAASTAIHLCVLALLALRTGLPPLRHYADDALEISLVPPFYLPRRAKAAPPSALRPRMARASSAAVAPLEIRPAESPPAAPPVAASRPTQALNGEVANALRQRLGCARTGLAGLTRAERHACEDALARGARQVAVLGQIVPLEKQAYYDAVMSARKSEGHGPQIGCHIRFGGGQPPSVERPAHALKLGPLPCYAVPPAGMLTPEVDVPAPY